MSKFDYFIIFAEMRTGSNFLEANINAINGLACYGEAFNPHFIGYPNKTDILGVSQSAREADPGRLIAAIKGVDGVLGGFRFFNDHDPRVLEMALDDPRCAKIILTRNPVESYVSLKIARATGQWKLTNVKHAKSETAHFDAEEFRRYINKLQEFQVVLLNRLQHSGQTAFYLAYEDLQDIEAMNGVAKFLGVDGRLDSLDSKLKRQNPKPIAEKVENFGDLEEAAKSIDFFNLGRTPNFEPRRGPVIPSYAAAPESPLLYMPVKSGPDAAVLAWLAAVDGKDGKDVLRGFTQKTLRQWKRRHKGHRSFTLVRHPVARAHAAFCDFILPTGPGSFPEIRATLRRQFNVPLPKEAPGDDYGVADHRSAFLGFLGFLKANLSGQTSVRVDANWASQAAIIQGFGQFALPDMIVRESRLQIDLAYLALSAGVENPPAPQDETDPHKDRLSAIYDEEVEAATQEVYQRDYMTFGFSGWEGRRR